MRTVSKGNSAIVWEPIRLTGVGTSGFRHFSQLRAILMSQSEIRRQAGQVTIWLDPSPDDANTFTKEYQAELREVLGPLLRDKELEVKPRIGVLDSVGAGGGYTGEFVIALAFIHSIIKVLVAWIQRKPGRKIRVEFHPSGKVKTVEAQTEEQILSLAKALDREARAEVPKTKPK
jgi:hypothetical protein